MYLKLMITIWGFLLVATLNAQSLDKSLLSHGPYLQNVTETSASILFYTEKMVLPSLTIKPEGDSSFTVMNSEDGLLKFGNGLHRIDVFGLKPATNYTYQVELKEIADYHPYKTQYGATFNSKEFTFSTVDQNTKKVNFTVFCDIHDKADKLGNFLKNNDVEKQNFYFLNGDIMGHIDNEAQLFSSFIDTCVGHFATQIPFFFVRGNHETRGKYARFLKNYLALENNKYYYAFTNGPARFVVLDGGEDKKDNHKEYSGLVDFDAYRAKELEWLKREVQSDDFKDAECRIVIIHMPIVQHKKNWYGMAQLAKYFGPVLKNAGIDLMICGHTHQNAWIAADESGFNYPIIISSNNHFIEAEVSTSMIKLERKDVDGNVEKTFVVKMND